MAFNNLQSFKIKGYKCFLDKNDYQGLDEIKPINVIIGKNNSGKSKLLEFLKDFVNKNQKATNLSSSDNQNLFLKYSLTEDFLKGIFREGARGGEYGFLINQNIGNKDHWNGLGKNFKNKIFICSSQKEIIDHGLVLAQRHEKNAYQTMVNEIAERLGNPFHNYECLAIQAERDVKREAVNFGNDNNFVINADGARLTEILAKCLHERRGHDKGWQALVEISLLEKINDVFFPDLKFTRILTKIDEHQQWEVYLEEEKKGGIRLSDCGSGIKTVILVMAMLYVVPNSKPNGKFIFMFEELENNLHPSLERKLMAHIRDYIRKNDKNLLFLTTHSNIAIDMFSKSDDAQILKVYNDGEASFIEKVSDWNEQHNLLDELGVRASDVLQSNCLIWLEGPSDRIYFNKWVELFNDGEPLEEGVHYQCLFYGGSVLSHYSAGEGDRDDSFIKMLHINRNAVVLMDSDRSKTDDALKPRVKKVIEDAENTDRMISWVTEGREIENYLPAVTINEFFDDAVSFGKFDIFANKYKALKEVQGFDKVAFASEIIGMSSYTRENLSKCLDLDSKMQEVLAHIRDCNN